MKALFLSGLLLLCASVYGDSKCQVDLHGDLQVTKTAIEFVDDDQRYKIEKDDQLWVNNREIKLTRNQKELVKQYASGVRNLLPEVRLLAVDSVDLAASAISIMLQELLGPNHQAKRKIDTEFSLLRKDIDKHFSAEQPISFSRDGNGLNLSQQDIFGKQLETRITTLVESVGHEVIWAVIKNMGAAMLSDASFENRMERFGEKMGSQMEARGQQVAQRAEKVCTSIKILDQQEQQLKKYIPALASFDVVRQSEVEASAENE